jgi:hypothetical protein
VKLDGATGTLPDWGGGGQGEAALVTVRELLRGPDPLDTIERWREANGRDLGDYDRAELVLERARLRHVLLILDDKPRNWRERRRVDWLAARLVAVEGRLR